MRIFPERNAIFLQTYFEGGRIVLELYYYYMVGGLVRLLSKRSLAINPSLSKALVVVSV